ncbi:hypothetical protein GCM10010320_77030 [Streptomyces caelestis]|jgi:hypothetical protein|uniref:Uncharacterized protein n=1 Tax=Streptomyces caelestis TaxID=36816 RepID=A0A7W9HCZ6_9ACTN|nr:hypothetical protein [Streptomyces caelestis]GGW83652.1 hypothetical protein GCM10010320_77030 [Streptomyces caelestis]
MTPDTDRPQADAVACTGLVHAFGETRAVDGLDVGSRDVPKRQPSPGTPEVTNERIVRIVS